MERIYKLDDMQISTINTAIICLIKENEKLTESGKEYGIDMQYTEKLTLELKKVYDVIKKQQQQTYTLLTQEILNATNDNAN